MITNIYTCFKALASQTILRYEARIFLAHSVVNISPQLFAHFLVIFRVVLIILPGWRFAKVLTHYKITINLSVVIGSLKESFRPDTISQT